MLVSCCVRSGMISSHYNRGFCYRTKRASKAKGARRWQQRRQRASVGGPRRVEFEFEVGLFVVCLLLLPLLVEDVDLRQRR